MKRLTNKIYSNGIVTRLYNKRIILSINKAKEIAISVIEYDPKNHNKPACNFYSLKNKIRVNNFFLSKETFEIIIKNYKKCKKF